MNAFFPTRFKVGTSGTRDSELVRSVAKGLAPPIEAAARLAGWGRGCLALGRVELVLKGLEPNLDRLEPRHDGVLDAMRPFETPRGVLASVTRKEFSMVRITRLMGGNRW
jgi:hypothetical protein